MFTPGDSLPILAVGLFRPRRVSINRHPLASGRNMHAVRRDSESDLVERRCRGERLAVDRTFAPAGFTASPNTCKRRARRA